jgi:phosphoglucomutase
MATPPTPTIIEEAADQCWSGNLEYRDAYSGRNMYGKECPAIVCDDMREFAEFIVEATLLDEDAGRYLASKVQQDSMGTGTVYYWPRIKADRSAS